MTSGKSPVFHGFEDDSSLFTGNRYLSHSRNHLPSVTDGCDVYFKIHLKRETCFFT